MGTTPRPAAETMSAVGPGPAGLVLPAPARAAVLDHLRATWPAEGCALLSGRTDAAGWWTVEAVHPAANVAEPACRHDRFEVDPAALFALMRTLREGPSRLIGHAHSHPGRPAVPSEIDRRAAHDPDLIWVIASLTGPDDPAPTLNAWAVAGWTPDGGADGFRPLPVRETAPAAPQHTPVQH